jgi:DNA-binding beta-propeller fold protein YncE
MLKPLAFCLLACAALPAQQIPAATELPGRPFYIEQTWVIGGEGNWDYLTLDPAARRLYIAHGHAVQVVDIDSGAVSGVIGGLGDAHAIALDDRGEYGYISDGVASMVRVFDRRTLRVVASIPTGPLPRALVFEPQSGLLFAVCATPVNPGPANPQPSARPQPRPGNAPARPPARTPAKPAAEEEFRSSITVIDAEKQEALADILMPGRLGFAATDGNGQVFINIVNRNQIARLDAASIGAMARGRSSSPSIGQAAAEPSNPTPKASTPQAAAADPSETPAADWSNQTRLPPSAAGRLAFLALGPDCREPHGLALDGVHQRLFAACANMKLVVLNAVNGDQLAALPIGPGVEAVGYDPGRNLIFTANGGSDGSLTVIRQHVTDTYSEIQNLPTRQRARTLAVDPVTGAVYLITDVMGVKTTPPGGIGSLQPEPVKGSFQVLAIGN